MSGTVSVEHQFQNLPSITVGYESGKIEMYDQYFDNFPLRSKKTNLICGHLAMGFQKLTHFR